MPVYESKRRSATGERVWRIVVWQEGRSSETTHTGKKKDAERKERALAAKLELEPKASPQRREAVSFSSFVVDTYQDHAKAHLAKSTWSVRRYQLDNLCRRHEHEDVAGRKMAVELGALKLTEIDITAGERYQAARVAEGAEPGTVNTEWAKLVAVLSYARRKGVPAAAPKLQPLPVRGKGRVKFWTRAQLQLLLATVEKETPELYGLVLYLALTGCRKGEGLACETTWIDLEKDMLRIEPNEAWQPKDGEPREIPIAASLRPWLERAKRSGRRYAFATTKRSKGRAEVTRWACFPRRRWERALRAAGLVDDLRNDSKGPHRLRHTYASLFLAGGGTMFMLSRILGHASIRTTEKTYAHMMPEHLEAARGLVDLGPAIGPAKLEARARWGTK